MFCLLNTYLRNCEKSVLCCGYLVYTYIYINSGSHSFIMTYSVNKAIIIGNLGRDPELRSTSSGSSLARFSVATTRKWRDRESDQMNEATEWHNITCFGRLAEIANDYLRKGSLVYIEGELRTHTYEREGQRHYSTEINARDLMILSRRGADVEEGSRSNSQDSYGNRERHAGDQGYQGNYRSGETNQTSSSDSEPDIDTGLTSDDIPF